MPSLALPVSSTWSAFVAVPENRSALRAVRGLSSALVRGKQPPIVPVFVHGASGSGKSHLISTLFQHLVASVEGLTARCIAAGDVARWAGEGDAGFADPGLVACDLLAIEDLQLLPARAAGALCDLLDQRTNRRRGLILTANAGPASLTHLPRKLTSRLAAGLVVHIEPYSPASRRAILVATCKARKIRLTAEALDWLSARSTGGGVRAMLGVLQNLAQVAAAYPGPLDCAAVKDVVSESGLNPSHETDIEAIIKRVASAFGITAKELRGTSRLRRVMLPRQVAMFLARTVCGLSLPRIGTALGRDHTTVLHAIRKVEAEMAMEEQFASKVRELQAELR